MLSLGNWILISALEILFSEGKSVGMREREREREREKEREKERSILGFSYPLIFQNRITRQFCCWLMARAGMGLKFLSLEHSRVFITELGLGRA